MKILRYTCLLVLSLLTLGSCSKFLEVEPTNQLTLQTYDDVRRLMGGHLRGYDDDRDRLRGTSRLFTLDDEWLLAHFYSDDYDSERYLNDMSRNNIGKFQSSLDWGFREASEDIWKHHYANIGFYNMIIRELEKNPSPIAALNEQVDAEARVLRAWSFFRLLQLFSPYKLNEYGLPLNTNVDNVGDYESQRLTQEENYRFITSELERVLAYTSEPKEGYNIFFDKKIINGLLAQVYHYKGGSGAGKPEDYSRAIQHARAVLNAGVRSDITLSIPNASHTSEHFGVHKDLGYTAISFVRSTSGDFISYVPGDVYYEYFQYPSKALAELFDDTDKRKAQFFDAAQGYVTKYNTEFIYPFEQVDYFRGSEMLLIVAESEARLGNEGAALSALAEFTQPRYTAYTRPAGTTTLEAILIERRKEFCFDPSMRWLDLTRLQTGFSRTYTNSQQVQTEYRLRDGDYKFCLPIPQRAELDQASIPQNPGWS